MLVIAILLLMGVVLTLVYVLRTGPELPEDEYRTFMKNQLKKEKGKKK